MSNFSPSSQPPNTGEPEDWRAYWKLQGQPWRTDPEISSDRKTFLTQRLTFELSTRYYNYPFKDVDLARADVEWLLDFYKHKSEDLSDKLQQGHNDLNLSCANLRKVNLRSLPLEGVDFNQARLEGANLREAHLEGANLREAHLEGADLTWIYLEGAYLGGSYLERADLREANLEGAILNGAHLGKASLIGAFLNGADLHNAHLEGANLYRIRLEGANLQGVHLEGADLNLAQLEEADLREAHLEGTNLREAHLEGADLSGAFFDGVTNLKDAALGNEKSGMVFLAGVHWGEVDLSVVDWLHPKILGDEFQACQQNKNNGEKKDSATRLDEFRTAVRANRQLATVLHEQGLNEEAAHFAYRAQLLQRQVLRYRRNLGQYLFSLFLDLLAGYGYRPGRSLIAYLVIIFGFMGLFLLNAQFATPHLRWDEALVLSLSSFHGRGFFPPTISLGDTYARIAASEAVIGLLIEVCLIATFTQGFFGR